jgi:hypothetical protein
MTVFVIAVDHDLRYTTAVRIYSCNDLRGTTHGRS